MASMHFSWSDSLHAAVSSCLPCLKHSGPDSDSESDAQSRSGPRPPRHPAFAHAIPPPRARPDELEGLLADASDDADALSLHTNPGERRARKKHKRRKGPKHIRVFGFDLFGRPPAIQLPESDDDEGSSSLGNGALRPGAEERERARKISTSTLDSDAAPLDVSTIEELSAARHADALAREEEERREKEERRRKRRERRELKRAAMAHALELQANGEDEFEGFQGSGPAYGSGMPFSPSAGTLSDSLTTSSQQEFGPFAHGQPVEPFDPDAAEAAREAAEAEVLDGADFGGESYTSRPRRSKSKRSAHGGGAGTMSTSDTRSSSSRSRSTGSQGYTYTHVHPGQGGGAGAAPYNHQFLVSPSGQAPTQVPRSPLSDSAPASPNVTERKKRRKSTKSQSSKSHAASLSVSTSSQSATASATASSPSPASPPPSASAPAHPAVVSHAGDDFEGFPGDFGFGSGDGAMVDFRAGGLGGEHGETPAEAKRDRDDAYVPVARFPSAGFSRAPSRTGDAGVFLARRGDE